MTQLELARQGQITDLVRQAAAAENIDPEILRLKIAAGTAVVCRNNNHTNGRPLAVGEGLRTKTNANIGTSQDDTSIDKELEKAKVAAAAGADALMDLSTGGLSMKSVPPSLPNRSLHRQRSTYQAACDAVLTQGKPIVDMSVEDIFAGVKKHLDDGVDFITVHCGVTRETVERMDKEGRIMEVVSRGGSFTVEWMNYNKAENPLYEHFDRLLELVRPYDAVLSLGDGFRPGCLSDATDRAQIQELIILGELTQRAQAAGIQVMIEGPGHVPLNQIEANMKLQKRICHGAPFYVLGPLVTDIAPGYDHITSAIGGTVAAAAGADFLCYVTPGEHLRLPTIEDVHEGVMAVRIAAHAADIVKGIPGAIDKDNKMAHARKALDWDGQFDVALDPEKARRLRRESGVDESHGACTMCGALCAYKVMNERSDKKAS